MEKPSHRPRPAADFRSGFVALVGRPNAGKSTLVNAVVGEQISIVTTLPQTTRQNLRGVYTTDSLQIVFVDTPGIHRGQHVLNKVMYNQGVGLLADKSIDVICYVVDLSRPHGDEEDAIVKMLPPPPVPVVIVFNKADACRSVERCIDGFFKRYPQLSSRPHIVVSALSAEAARRELLRALTPLLKIGPMYFPADDLTDADMRFLAAECVRKQCIELTREEVPHAVHVEILAYREQADCHEIDAAIHVETDGQKAIVIGAKGSLIRRIQNEAAADIGRLTDCPVKLRCHVKVTPKWRDSRRFLERMGLSRQLQVRE